MEAIKFGEDYFSVYPVFELLKGNDASYRRLCDSWMAFGYSLHLTRDDIGVLEEKLSSGETELQDIPREVLRLWKSDHEDKANLKVLYEALIDVQLVDLAGLIRDEFGGSLAEDVSEPARKRSRLVRNEDSGHEAETINLSDNDEDSGSTASQDEDDGVPPLFRAIREGQSADHIKKLLDEGANVNFKPDDDFKWNAAHEVIRSLKNGTRSLDTALAILNLLMKNGFRLINDGDIKGHTPLHHAMEFEDLNEELLTWFSENGADFNAVTNKTRSSPLSIAIMNRQSVRILRKILDFGGNPKHVNRWKSNALHVAAAFAYDSAMEILIDELDINEGDEINQTPLHYLFTYDHFDYQHCLKTLLKKGADVAAESVEGNVPLVEWMKYGKGNPFPALIKLKDTLPITQEMASKTLTVIVTEIERFKKFFPSAFVDTQNEFVQFMVLLMQQKDGKIRWKDDCQCQWEQQNWGILKPLIVTRKFLKELRTTGGYNWNGRFTATGSTSLGTLDVLKESGGCIIIPFETVLVCLLGCKEYRAFVEVCRFVEMFCAEP